VAPDLFKFGPIWQRSGFTAKLSVS
jgi:hypothetical protein